MEGTTATAPTTTSAPSAPAAVTTPTSGATTATPANLTPAERPKTMAEAFARDAASQTPTTSTPPDGATTPPVEATETTSATSPSTEHGPVPVPVHVKALENARVKAVDEFRKTSGVDQAIALADRINTSPAGFVGEYIAELLADPKHAQSVKAVLARTFGGLRQQAPKPAPIDLNPDMQVVDNDGRVVGATFSAEKVKALLEQTVAPLKQESEQRKTEQAQQKAKADAAEMQKQIATEADRQFARVTRLIKGNTELIPHISALMDADPSMDVHDAALEVLEKFGPSLEAKSQAQVLKDLQTKAASQAVNPAGAVVAATSRPKSFLDKSLKW